ncbi:MAG TPA: response regulator [Acidimicrobiales bacterium]|nr:response regulator [Acidimicrobiales bacterium]
MRMRIDVLVVEDNEDVRTSLVQVLRTAGYRVAEAEDGHAALQALDRVQPRMILLDLQMPRLGGVEFLQRLQEPPPVVVVSALPEYRVETSTRVPGIRAYLQKPVQPASLIEVVVDTLSSPSAP